MLKNTIILFSKLFFGDRVLWRMPVSDKTVFLTFDDGPDPEITPKVLQILSKYDAKATFFCLGEKAEKHPAMVEMIIQNGHSTGYHGYEHLSGWTSSVKKYYSNLVKCESFFQSRAFRPPYGRITFCQARAISRKYKIVMWSLMSKDYSKKMTPEKCIARLKKKAKQGDIIVFHDNPQASINCLTVLPVFLEHLKLSGYKAEGLSL